MANTIMSAKNSFEQGLIMDFSPDNTQANCLTSALNATLLTFNGNEMQLQNDMGNGRVETAYLPEGYIPVGTCEFGDIVYIVSYNPLINKSQIGCFPSPERNISSEEIGNLQQKLSWKDFQEGNEVPNGKLKASSVKKIIFEKSLNPGDKYFAYIKHNSKEDPLVSNQNTITDVGNSLHLYGDYPKLLRIHLVAIEDGGKINYLDNTVKWYGNKGTEYFLQSLKLAEDQTPDLDSYRTIVSDAYTVFQSKVSGKLAILAELEKITGFSCTHSVHTQDNFDENKKYKNTNYQVYLHTSWETNDLDVNPSGYVILESKIDNEEYGVLNGIKNIKDDNPDFIEISKEDSPDIQYKNIYYRHYKIEDACTYEEYVQNMSFASLKEKFINEYTNGNDNNYIPNKITQLKEKGKGYSNKFVYNAFNYDENGWYFANNIGEKQYVFGNNAISKYSFNQDENQNTKFYSDSFIHNYFNTDIIKPFYNLNITKLVKNENGKEIYSDLSGLIHRYTICPAMPYGYLEEYSVTNSIDFSKVGSGLININEWRYYNDEEVSTLTFGLEAYPENGKGISKVKLEFYDNNGLTGTLEIKDRTSYSGTFTEILTLNSSESIKENPLGHPGMVLKTEGINLSINPDGTKNNNVTANTIIKTAHSENFVYDVDNTCDLYNLALMYQYNIILIRYEGEDNADLELSSGDIIYYNTDKAKKVLNNNVGNLVIYQSDAGILYSNWLYLVKIKIYYQNYNSLGIFDEPTEDDVITFERWYWTNNMWNEHYHSIYDYSVLQPKISLQVEGSFIETNSFRTETTNTPSLLFDHEKEETVQKQTLGYNEYKIYTDSEESSNLELVVIPKIANNYNTFFLNGNTLAGKNINNPTETIKEYLSYDIYEGDSKINVIDNPEKIFPKGVLHVKHTELLNPTKEGELSDSFKLDIIDTNYKNKLKDPIESVEYVGINGEQLNTKNFGNKYNFTSSYLYNKGNFKGIDLNIKGNFYSKIMYGDSESFDLYCPIYYPILKNLDTSLDDNNLKITPYKTDYKYFSFKYLYNFDVRKNGGLVFSMEETNNVGRICQRYAEDIFGEKDNTPRSLKSVINNISENDYNIKGYFLPITYINDRSSDTDKRHMFMWLKNLNHTNIAISTTWNNKWGKAANDSNTAISRTCSDFVGQSGENTWSDNWAQTTNRTNAHCVMQLAVQNYSGDWVPINAVSRLGESDSSAICQRFGKTNGSIISIGGFASMAGIIASLLSQIYLKSEDSQSIKKQKGINPIVNNYYEETWHKDFVIVPKVEQKIEDLITIKSIPFNTIIENFKSFTNIENIPNITFSFIESTSLLQFQHICKYDINQLLNDYSNNEVVNQKYVYISEHLSKEYGNTLLELSPSEVLYLNLNDKDDIKVQNSPEGIILQPFDYTGKLSRQNSGVYMSDFIQNNVLKVKNNKLMLSPIETGETVEFGIESEDDDNEWTYLKFNRNLQVKNFAV